MNLATVKKIIEEKVAHYLDKHIHGVAIHKFLTEQQQVLDPNAFKNLQSKAVQELAQYIIDNKLLSIKISKSPANHTSLITYEIKIWKV